MASTGAIDPATERRDAPAAAVDSPPRPAPLSTSSAHDSALPSPKTVFTPIHSITPGKSSFKPKLSLFCVAADAAILSPSSASPRSPLSPSSPHRSSAESVHARSVIATNSTFRSDMFEIRPSSFSRRSSAILPSSGSSSASSSGTSSPFNEPNPSHLSPLSSQHLKELSTLGKGASGTVLKCLHLPSNTLIALKSIDVSAPSKRAQLLQELHHYDGAAPRSPHFVGFLGAFYQHGAVRLALEYMDRGCLQSILKAHGALAEPLIADITHQALLALQHLHSSHAIHRDIKPGNFLIDHMGQVKLSDFGLLATLDSTLARRQTFIGTLVYMSPERLKSEDYSTAADIWSLGITCLALCNGGNPLAEEAAKGGYFAVLSFVSSTPQWHVPSHYSTSFQDFIQRCLAVDVAERWSAERLLGHPFISNRIADRAALLALWPPGMRMGRADDEEEGRQPVTDKRKSGLQKIRDNMLLNARKEKERRDRAKSADEKEEERGPVISKRDDLSSLNNGNVLFL